MKIPALVLLWAFASTALAATPDLTVTMAPGAAQAGGEIDHVDVRIEISDLQIGASQPLLAMPLVAYNVVSVAMTLSGLEVRDAKGPLRLAVRDDAESPAGYSRHWTTDRAVAGPLAIRYRTPITNKLAPLGPAPPTELRSEAHAFSGMGGTFLILPENTQTYRLAVRWDLSALEKGSVGVSSLGLDDAVAERPDTVERLKNSFFMAGKIGRFPATQSAQGFYSAWQGETSFDTRALLESTQRLYTRYSAFFKDAAPPLYGVFLRRNVVNPNGGMAFSRSFVATFDQSSRPIDLKFTLAHEMFHSWDVSLDIPATTEASWYEEGLAVFYARLLALRFDAATAEEFLDDLNYYAGRYYTNALADRPNSELATRFWEETRIRTLAYDRGSFYFAAVNDEVRKASGGRRSLDDLLFAMMDLRRKGKISAADWEAVVGKELGPRAVEEFRAMLAGKLMVPASDAFGPCFRRTMKPLRRYELGFEPKVLAEPRRIVRNLLPGSAAEAAGLRNGDEILKPVGQDHIQGDQQMPLTLEVRRDGRDFVIKYLPRGETVQAYQWERIGNQPDSACTF